MFKLALFDVGETLLHNGQPFPHVTDALSAIARLRTEAGEKLVMAIVSDFGETDASTPESKIRSLEQEFAAILSASALDQFFLPFEARVTISGRAGAMKPDQRIFDTALRRSGTGATLSECIFVTENLPHLRAASDLGMSVLGFGTGAPGLPAFADWIDAPLMIANAVAPADVRSREQALTLALKERNGIDEFKSLSRSGETFRGQGTVAVQLDGPRLGALGGSFAKVQVDVSVRCAADGRIADVIVADPTAEDIEDAVSNIQQLVARGQVAAGADNLPPGTTHAVEMDGQGRRVIVRKRYS